MNAVATSTARMERLVRDMRALRPAPGVERVLAPGYPEWQGMQTAAREGVLVDPEVWDELTALAREHGVLLAGLEVESR